MNRLTQGTLLLLLSFLVGCALLGLYKRSKLLEFKNLDKKKETYKRAFSSEVPNVAKLAIRRKRQYYGGQSIKVVLDGKTMGHLMMEDALCLDLVPAEYELSARYDGSADSKSLNLEGGKIYYYQLSLDKGDVKIKNYSSIYDNRIRIIQTFMDSKLLLSERKGVCGKS